jgi:glycosyltransferase involved in cell wall biosynthesis
LKRHQPELLAVINELVEASEKGIGHLSGSMAEFLFGHFAKKLSHRIETKISGLSTTPSLANVSFDDIVEKLEIPGVVRTLVNPDGTSRSRSARKMSLPSIGEFFDGLSFPFLASGLVAGSMFATARVLHGKRSFSDSLAKQFPHLKVPDRVLWLTDTLIDKNGVSNVLQLTRNYAAANNLPIDFLVCHESLESAANLKVISPLSKFELSFYPQQPFRIPNLAEIQKICDEGGYTTVVCSTEGPMALAALYLKHAHRLPVHFYVHTDWMEFSRQNEKLRDVNQDRVRRFLRSFYSQFDSVFVLNSEQKRLFESESFQLSKVHQTAHWPSESFTVRPEERSVELFGLKKSDVVLLFAGRLSAEKGVFQLPEIYRRAKNKNSAVTLIVAGTGPDEIKLKELIPDAIFAGWQSQEALCRLYNRADLLLLPSTFDTFGCVVVEAMSCGLPVCAYAVKGPADIIEHGVNGLLARTPDDFAECVELFVTESDVFANMRKHAQLRAQTYSPERIMGAFLRDLNVGSAVERVTSHVHGVVKQPLSSERKFSVCGEDSLDPSVCQLSNLANCSNFAAVAPS